MLFDTIGAIATPPGEGGIGIIRVSGPESWLIAGSFFKSASGKEIHELPSHTVNYGHFLDQQGNIMDECLVTVMRGPKTFTREDTVEINCHGGFLPLQQVMKVLLSGGVRLAEPGEFTKRAFLNGRIDLAQAESIIDIIRAKTEHGLLLAVNQLRGNLSVKLAEIRTNLLKMLAAFEANIDFPEDDVPPVDYQQVDREIDQAIGQLSILIESWNEGKIYIDGLKTVIAGRPNVGKSSLLNVLAKEERAIVTDIPGTTRDVIEEIINLKGVPLKIIDTAGIRETTDLVEKLGVEKSLSTLDKADLVLMVIDATSPLTEEDRMVLHKVAEKNTIVLLNKADLPVNEKTVGEAKQLAGGKPVLKISAKEVVGIDHLAEAIKEQITAGKVRAAGETPVTNARHHAALARAFGHLENIKDGLRVSLPVDFLSIDLTAAYEALGEITGETVGEDILDRIFAEFCIGK
ncbi:MAG: tRNA uridine-5-carboxymethylaminomethyl(34) synthesis GTPase MnmE [Clostridia bacterium]|nr:tRNA uridine-5-carboxymethylaminomethyl(34) synthesis GTPase MnmE [Clostridia bacterium]